MKLGMRLLWAGYNSATSLITSNSLLGLTARTVNATGYQLLGD
jgi:hypothetical protein